MSSIYKPKNSKNYYISIKLDGKWTTRSLGVSSKKEALEVQRILDYENAKGAASNENFVSSRDRGKLLYDFLDDVVAYLKTRKNYSHKTLSAYNLAIRQLKEVFEDISMKHITRRRIETKLLPYLESKHSQGSVTSYMSRFSAIFKYAIRWEILDKNPFHLTIPKPPNYMPVYFEPHELKKIIAYFDSEDREPWVRDFFMLKLNTGLRRAEMVDLRWDINVMLRSKQLKFRGKGNKERIVPLNDEAVKILTRRRRKLGYVKVFFEIKKNPHSVPPVTAEWNRARKALGIKAKLHALRSNYASWFIMNGGDSAALKEIMGWQDWKTLDRYLILSPDYIMKHRRTVEFSVEEIASKISSF